MRLWHEDLIPKLPQKQLYGQWRECIALLGNGWGKKHSTVDYVFNYDESYLVAFTLKVAKEMRDRKYNPDTTKIINALRKRYNDLDIVSDIHKKGLLFAMQYRTKNLYPEHNDQYYQECIENLRKKGIIINDNN